MRITKQKLKEIIKEEFQRITPPGDGLGDNDDGYPPERPFPRRGNDLKAEIEARAAAEPESASFWQKILAAVEKANLFPRAEE